MNNKTINYYNKYAKSFIQTTRSVDFKNIQNKFLSCLPPKASILDFGCGSGRDTKYFLKQNYKVTAIDGSKAICKEASKYTGIKVKQMLFEEFDDQDSYDGIWACASILHLPQKDLLSVFHKMNQVLKENGIIYTSFKYGKFEGERNGRYFTDFTEETFKEFILQIPQLQIKEIWITGDAREGRGDERWLNILIYKKNILEIEPKYHNKLNIEGFSKMMKDPSFCYKFYWLEAIVQLISEGKTETTFDEIIDEMIANAWYSVREFHIHLSGMPMDGQIKDGLERAVLQLTKLSNLPANASKVQIKNAIQKYNKELKEVKEQLTHMVPYRALAGFFIQNDEKINWNSTKRMVAYIQKFNKEVVTLPYLLGTSSKLKKEVYFQQDWIKMIQDHTVNILGWIQYEKVKWLQNNNPEVPGLVYKLTPMDEQIRKLKNVRNLWKGIMEFQEIRDVFTGQPVKKQKYDIDHFIPWSFVMNDELWNLMPMDSSLNSSKSNRLPKWNPFFKNFARNQYLMYQMIYENSEIYDRFKRCYKDNLHSIWAGQELYRKGNSKEIFCNILEKNMMPVYDSARRQGYEIWTK